MATGLTRLTALAHILRPRVAQVVEDDWSRLWPYRAPISWRIYVDYITDNIMFGIPGKGMVLVTRHEFEDNAYKASTIPRLKHWLRKNLPRPHKRYVPIAAIKTRRPLEES